MEHSEEEADLLTSTKRRSQQPKRAETAGVKGCRRRLTSDEKAAVWRQLGRERSGRRGAEPWRFHSGKRMQSLDHTFGHSPV